MIRRETMKFRNSIFSGINSFFNVFSIFFNFIFGFNFVVQDITI